MMRNDVLASVATASAFQVGYVPKAQAAPAVTRLPSAPVMMPKFIKDLFPEMDKPDDFLGGIKKMFGMEDEEPAAPAPAEEEPAPADEPAPEDSEE